MLALLTLINYKLKDESLGIIKAAFGIYLGWICIATIANVTTLLVDVNWGAFGLSEQAWAIVMIATGLVVTSLVATINNSRVSEMIDWRIVAITSVGAALAAWWGTDLMHQLKTPTLTRIFGVSLILFGIKMLWQTS